MIQTVKKDLIIDMQAIVIDEYKLIDDVIMITVKYQWRLTQHSDIKELILIKRKEIKHIIYVANQATW